MKVEDIENKLRYCDCGESACVFVSVRVAKARCSFCPFSTGWGEPEEIIDKWNNRGGPCEECGKPVEIEGEEICRECWDKAATPPNAHESAARR